jgi:ribosomal protein L3
VSDKHLERKEVLNIVYTQQAERMADAYARLMSDFSQMTAWGRGLESDLSWARAELLQVKAELERVRLIAHDNKQALYNAKAEVDELTLENSQYEEHHKYGQNVITSLRDEVERLTKAGDAMLSEWASGEEKDAKNFLKALAIWNAAKEGKQS